MAPSHLKGPSEDYRGTSWVIRCDEKKVQRHRSRPASTTPTLSSAIAVSTPVLPLLRLFPDSIEWHRFATQVMPRRSTTGPPPSPTPPQLVFLLGSCEIPPFLACWSSMSPLYIDASRVYTLSWASMCFLRSSLGSNHCCSLCRTLLAQVSIPFIALLNWYMQLCLCSFGMLAVLQVEGLKEQMILSPF